MGCVYGVVASVVFCARPVERKVFEKVGMVGSDAGGSSELVMRFINKEELMTGNEDLTVQFGEDPPWDDLPPVDREKANKELESRLIFDSWTCRFCGGTFADRTLAIKHAIDCDDNEDVHSCATCASYEIGEDTRDGYRHICKGNPKRIDTWMKHCPEWIGA